MSFGTIATTTTTFNPRNEGRYVASTVEFGSPEDELRVRPNNNKKTPNVAVSRYKQFDVTEGANTIRVGANCSLTINIPAKGVTPTQVDQMVSEISEFVNSVNLSRMLQGEA